jgi:subtilisin family serine protease
MRTLITRLAILMLLALGLFIPVPAVAQDSPPPEEPVARPFAPAEITIPPFTPGTVLVGVRGDPAALTAASTPAWEGIEVLAAENLDLRTSPVNAASDGEELLIGYKLTVPAGSEWATIEALSARDDVVFAEPDWLAHIAVVEPNKAVTEVPYIVTDTLYREQWYMQRIGMSRAWSLVLQESGGNLNTIDVFVLDTGVDAAHPDLMSVLNEGRNYVDSQASPHDDHGHGTHVTGLVAASANGTGTIGPALAVRITPFKVLRANGSGPITGIAQAIRDAADMGADIINLSLTTTQDAFALRSAVLYATNSGALVIAATGNQGANAVSFPAAYPNVLAVGATSYLDLLTFYSNTGPEVDLVAPGGLTANSILSTWTRDFTAQGRDTCDSPTGRRVVNGGVYCHKEGTSMATGIVSGVAALIMSLRPDLSASEVEAILLDSAAPVPGSPDEVGRGRLDAVNAVRMALEPRLEYDPNGAKASAVEGEGPFVLTLPLSNPSLVPLHVEVTPTAKTSWHRVLGPFEGDISYGKPLEVQLLYTPTTTTMTGLLSTMRVAVTDEDGGTSFHFINVGLDVYPGMVGDERLFMPWTSAGGNAFVWEEPGISGRTMYTIGNNSSVVVDLPFTLTIGDRNYSNLRVFADGFVVAPGSASPPNFPNECLDNQVWPSFSVYGWWSDLSQAVDSELSTFQPSANRFVIEYKRFVSMGSSDPNDRVSFQIVLDRTGRIELNYGDTPLHAPANLTVGASIEDGRFYNQVTCHIAGSTKIGDVPLSNQSIIFTLDELY